MIAKDVYEFKFFTNNIKACFGLFLLYIQLYCSATAAITAQAAAAQAASDLDVASKVTVVGVVNGGRTICAVAMWPVCPTTP